ncbi:sensor histidine kinase [Roseovarius aestuarii]|uniref:histidine kinase n=2 Tax=Roseovarius aestuarii TaxID=475083 RepID=A0A1X7BNP6_9RHOB|nr:ATP-binding protein [Roseovarius aestuarii]SMC11211.1 Sensor kinase CusS [Roseovarius aestuarii]
MSALRQAMVLSLSFLVLLSIGGALFEDFLTKELQTEIDTELKQEFAGLSRELTTLGQVPDDFASGGLPLNDETAYGFLRSDGTVMGPVKIEVFAADGLRTLQDEEIFPEDVQQSIMEALEKAFDTESDDESDVVELPFDGEFDTLWRAYVGPALDGQLVVFSPTVGGLVAELSTVILIALVLISIPTMAVGVVFGLRAQRRLDRIGQGYERIADGDLTVRLAPKVVKDDLDLLTQRIDGATERLQTTLRQMSEFSANIAHDLRTPLTRLRIHLDQANEANDLAAHLNSSISQTDNIIAIFDAIQRIARLKTGERRAKFKALDLGNVASQVHDIYEAVAEDEGRTLICNVSNPVIVDGDINLLIQLLSNLIENAIRHTEVGATITLSVRGRWLSVSDDGPGIPEEECEKVLEPLYRLDHSRNTPGAGLGLSLVKVIADLHEANMTLSKADTNQQKGLLVKIEFRNPSSTLASPGAVSD